MKTSRGLAALIGFAFASLTGACSSTPAPGDGPPAETPTATTPLPVDAPPSAARPEMSAADCEAQGGTLVGDIGDGAVHKPDYKCPSGAPPVGRVSLGIEGSVCCK